MPDLRDTIRCHVIGNLPAGTRKRWRVDFVDALELGGTCDPPGLRDRTIRVLRSSTGKVELTTTVHETLHAAIWCLDEPAVKRLADRIGDALYDFSVRRSNTRANRSEVYFLAWTINNVLSVELDDFSLRAVKELALDLARLLGRCGWQRTTVADYVLPLPQLPVLSIKRAVDEYAARRWPIVPAHTRARTGLCSCNDPHCPTPGFHTRVPLNNATCDRRRLGAWWRKWPTANPWLVLGGAAGLICIEARGPEAAELFGAWQSVYRSKASPFSATWNGSTNVYLYSTNETHDFRGDIELEGDIHLLSTGCGTALPPSALSSDVGPRLTWQLDGLPDDRRERPPTLPDWLAAKAQTIITQDPGAASVAAPCSQYEGTH